MKHIASLTILVLVLTACVAQPTPTPTPTTTLTATPTAVPSATPSPTPTISPAVLTQADEVLSYEQQKQQIEDNFEQGTKVFEAVEKEDGNLEYYDGSWHTIKQMITPEGYVIPWGEIYYTKNETDNRKLENIIGKDKLMDIDNWLEEINGSLLFLQAIPDNTTKETRLISQNMGEITLNFLLILKDNGKIIVIDKPIRGIGRLGVINLYENKGGTSYSWASEIAQKKLLQPGLITISSKSMLESELEAQIVKMKNGEKTETESEFITGIVEANVEEVFTGEMIERIANLHLTSQTYIEVSPEK